MEDYNSSFYYTNSTWNDYYGTWNDDYSSYNYGYSPYYYDNRPYNYDSIDPDSSVNIVVNSIIISSGVPLCALAVYVLYSLVRHDRAPAPVYVINLLISDIIQICWIIVSLMPFHFLGARVLFHIYIFCVFVSVAFMACIALERYLLVAWPLWYRFRRPTRTSVVVSALIWIVCLVVIVVLYFHGHILTLTILNIWFLLPFPLFIFCLGGTLRALSSCRLPADEKQRIVAVLVLVLLIYTLLFLPAIVSELTGSSLSFDDLPFMLLKLNPLADSVLYIFMQKGAVGKLMASMCCRELNSNGISISNV